MNTLGVFCTNPSVPASPAISAAVRNVLGTGRHVRLLVPDLFPICAVVNESTFLLDLVDQFGHPREDVQMLVETWRLWSLQSFGVALPMSATLEGVSTVVSA